MLVTAPASSQVVDDYTLLPPTVVDSTTPLVMLVMSRDNQLWHKAYNDYSDLDGDGILDTTYNDGFEYYGYFHADYCYQYSNSSGVFSPVGTVLNLAPTPPQTSHKCSGAWSGNFLNWMTTTRIDVVRKVLYGGYRLTDTNSSTVLQRAYVPSDNHAFVKIVANSNIDGTISDYTPITGRDGANDVLSFCNVTDVVSGSSLSRNVNVAFNPPKLKVAIGNELAWAGSETRQCQYEDEGGPAAFSARRPNSGAISGIPSNSELNVRVNVCVAGQDADAMHNNTCQEYTDEVSSVTNVKPFGLLQTYGEAGTYKFGLMTGSYTNNSQGGVLRKNISFLGGEDATPADIEIDSQTGIFVNQTTSNEGIINTLNRLRIQGWNHQNARYDDCNAPGISQNDFLNSTNGGRQCRDWGNPLSEIYLEALRYIGAASPTTAFQANDSGILPGLGQVSWQDPFDPAAPCSQCSIIVLSTGLNNFDGDQLNSASSLPGFSAANMRAETDRVGVAEGVTSGTHIVGVGTSGGNVDVCDAKSISNFSSVSGPCPELPSLNGTYNIAGASFFAHQNDLRPDLDGTQDVSTYTVALAESLPSFRIPSGSSNAITIVPTCHSSSNGASNEFSPASAWRVCSLVDLTVVRQTPEYGRFVIAWEDSPWGNDYDQDAYSVIEYCTDGSACPDLGYNDDNPFFSNGAPGNFFQRAYYDRFENQPGWQNRSDVIQIRVSVPAASAGFSMRFGYTVNGSQLSAFGDDDGAYINEIVRYGGYNFNSLNFAIPGSDFSLAQNNRVIWSQRARAFRVGAASSSVSLLENPLWYAAKYGAFDDFDDDGLPGPVAEWDKLDINGDPALDNSGNIVGDGIPDSFFPVSNPASLPQALRSVLANISTRTSSGSAAAVNAQTGSGEGAIYQALYSPRLENRNDNGTIDAVTWFGTVNALFIDSRGRIREDLNQNGILENGDRILTFQFDPVIGETMVQATEVQPDGSTGSPVGTPFTLTSDEYNPIWSAQEMLRSLATYTNNRSSYESSASSGRYIFTAFDRDNDGLVISPEFNDTNPGSTAAVDGAHPFVSDTFALSGNTANDHRLLGFEGSTTDAEVENLVNFIRGEEGIPGTRSRTLNGESNLLGDIVNSTPEVVGAPREPYALLYNDDSYQNYINQYANRRNVLYVGANDGMLHAFNAGFFNPETSSGGNIGFETAGGNGAGHPLGSELWAYIPYNVLPHLQWLAAPNYPHVYYVDGPVRAYDVNIFAPDDVHPDGWGTIIVASMRFGGGDYSLDHDNDASTPDITTRSAYIIMDVTDPERPPELIAEITDEDLGFTTSEPTIVKYRRARSNGSFSGATENAWYLAFGSGPAGTNSSSRLSALNSAVSNKSAKVYLFDLVNRTLEPEIELTDLSSNPEANSFTGGFEVADWDLDYRDDAVYFGLVGGTPSAPTGKLKRGRVTSASGDNLSFNFSRDLYNESNRAFSAKPRTVRDVNNDYWVFAGTGRFFVAEDNLSTQQQYYYGIKEPQNSGGSASLSATIPDNDLVDVTDADVFEDGQVRGPGLSDLTLSGGGQSRSIEIFSDILDFVSENDGWRFEFRLPGILRHTPGSGNLMRNTTQAALAGTSLVITSYNATGEFCSSEGEGFLFTPHLGAGRPAPFAPVGTDPQTFLPSLEDPNVNVDRVLQGVTLGVGIPSDPTVSQFGESDGNSGGNDPCQGYQVFSQSSTAEISSTNLGCQGLPAGRRGWREIPIDFNL